MVIEIVDEELFCRDCNRLANTECVQLGHRREMRGQEGRDLVSEARELFENEPPWTVETHDARGDYVKIALVRRAPEFTCGYYVIASDDMQVRRDQAIADFAKMVKARELLSALCDEVERLRLKVGALTGAHIRDLLRDEVEE